MTGVKSTLIKLSLVVVAMYGFSYALVPIYDKFCEITGLNGKTNQVAYIGAEFATLDINLMVTNLLSF